MEKVQELIQSYQKEENSSVISQVQELLQTEEGMFAIVARVTNNFYMGTANGKPAAFIYTCREYADAFVKEMRSVGVETKSLDIRPEQRIGFFNDLYRSGFEAVVINKDHESLSMSLFSIIEKPEQTGDMVVNPDLMCAAIRFYQGLASQHLIKEMQDLVCAELFQARFLYPQTDPRYPTPALLTDNKGKKFCPVFTDPVEFGKFDKKHRYHGTVVKFRDLKKLMEGADGIVVNPFGFGLRLSQEKLERIERENQKLKVVN